MKTVRTVLLIFAAAGAPALASGPTWDISGNSQLSGTYYFRNVLYVADSSGNTSRAISFFGNIAFSSGTYTLSGTNMVDSGGGFSVSSTGTYSVSASGYGFMSNPLITGGSISFLVSNHVIVGGDTESGYNDLFIAAPYTSTLANSSLSGAYTIAGFFPGGAPASSAGLTFQLNPDGAGHLNTVNVSGYYGTGNTIAQNSSGVTYSVVNGAAVLKFPTSSTSFYSGSEYLYISPDSNFVFGGSPNGYDIFVGVRNATGGASTLSGLYYEAGLDESTSPAFDTYYGSFNAVPGTTNGSIIGHERLLFSNSSAEGYTYYDSYPTTVSGSYTNSAKTAQYTVGQGGIRISFGLGGSLGLGVALPYTPPAASTKVYIDPTGIVNTASSAPYTAGIAPGEFLTLYNGVNLANSVVIESGAPYPTTLGGVQVLIDGIAAPIYYVSSTQVSVIVPYSVSTFPIASIQVINNNTASNIVTTYVHQTSPGVFTSNPVGGIGFAAMLDFPPSGGYFIVGQNKPVQPGDTVALYLTGLGTPFPSNGDGALGPASGDILVNNVAVDIGGTSVGTLAYAGLAPALAGLYQINFTVPASITTAGNYALGITGIVSATNGSQLFDSYTNESLIPIGSGGSATASVRTSADATAATHTRLPRFSGSVTR